MTSSGRKSQYLSKTDEALGVVYDNAEMRRDLETRSELFLKLLQDNHPRQFMRHRYSDDPT